MLAIFARQPQNNEEIFQLREDAKTLPSGVRCIKCHCTDTGWLIENLATGEILTRKQYERKHNKKLALPPCKPPKHTQQGKGFKK